MRPIRVVEGGSRRPKFFIVHSFEQVLQIGRPRTLLRNRLPSVRIMCDPVFAAQLRLHQVASTRTVRRSFSQIGAKAKAPRMCLRGHTAPHSARLQRPFAGWSHALSDLRHIWPLNPCDIAHRGDLSSCQDLDIDWPPWLRRNASTRDTSDPRRSVELRRQPLSHAWCSYQAATRGPLS